MTNEKVVNMDEWHVGDPADWGDHVGVPDIPYMGYLNNEDDNDNNERDSDSNRQYRDYIRKASECSQRGDHSKAIDYYKKAKGNVYNKFAMMRIAKEYEYMGEYENALIYWKDLCKHFNHSADVFEGHANLAYRMGKYEEAISSYRQAVSLLENNQRTSPQDLSRLYSAMAQAYAVSGQSDIAKSYQDLAKTKKDDFVKKYMEQGDKYKEECKYSAARTYYKAVLNREPNNVEAKIKFDKVDRVCKMDTEAQNRFKRDCQKQRKELKRKREDEERRKRLEKMHREMEEREERAKREKELKERNPEYLKLKIESHKKVFEISHLRLHLGYYQRKSNRAFEEIFRLEKLLEERKDEKSYPNDDINAYKREIKHLEYCISHFNAKYIYHAKKLLKCYQNRLDKLEKKNKIKINII